MNLMQQCFWTVIDLVVHECAIFEQIKSQGLPRLLQGRHLLFYISVNIDTGIVEQLQLLSVNKKSRPCIQSRRAYYLHFAFKPKN